jgi:hypothetical protein
MGALTVARALATALDASDYNAARNLMDTECAYDPGTRTITGREAIIASYREADDWGRTTLDQVVFKSTVCMLADRRAAIDYLDRLRHRGHAHDHRCRQIVTVNDDGLVAHIEHVDLPGEPEALQTFFEQVGVQR